MICINILTSYLSTILETIWWLRKVELSEAELAKVTWLVSGGDRVHTQVYLVSELFELLQDASCELNKRIKAGDIFRFTEKV